MRENFAQSVLPWVFMFASVLILVAFWVVLYLANTNLISTGVLSQIDRNDIVSKVIVDYSGLLAALIVVGGVIYRTWDRSIPLLFQEVFKSLRSPPTISASQPSAGSSQKNGISQTRKLFSAIFKEILLLGRMGECEDFQQWLSHFLIMWGFIGLAVTTTLDAIVNFAATPLPLISPVRLLGNIAGIIFVAGLTLSIARRALNEDVREKSRRGDWTFLLSLYGTAITGFAVQIFSDTGNLFGTWVTYPAHLAFIAFLLIFAPWTKFVHALWRPSWIVQTRLKSQA